MSLVRHESQQYANPAALTAETVTPTANDEVHIESLNRRFNWLEGSTSTSDDKYVIAQANQTANGRWAATAVEGAKVFTGSVSTGAIPNGNTAVITVSLADGASSTLLAKSGAALGITNGGTFPKNVFLDSIVLTADNTAQINVVNESGNDVAAFNVDVKAIDYTGIASGVASGGSASKRIDFGTETSTTAYSQKYNITFASMFTAVPFVTVSSHIKEDKLNWNATNVSTSGFILDGYGLSTNAFTGTVEWKAEEK